MHQVYTYKPQTLTTIDLEALEIGLVELSTRRRFLIGAGGLLGAAALGACGASEEAVAPTTMPGATRTITHPRGTTEIPADPQRVVIANDFLLGNALSLGVPVIGAAGDPREPGLRRVPYDTSEIENLGAVGEPNLERLLELEPDLIITIEHNTSDDLYNNFLEIAPTVPIATIFDDGAFPTFTEFNQTFAEIVGRTELMEEQFATYEERLSEVRSQIDPIREELDFNVVTAFGAPASFSAIGQDFLDVSAYTVVIRDLGIVPDNATEGVAEVSVSIERITEWDADVLVVLAPGGEADEFFEVPLVQALNASKAGQVFEVPQGRWNARYADALLTVLDDLEEFLIESNPDLSVVD